MMMPAMLCLAALLAMPQGVLAADASSRQMMRGTVNQGGPEDWPAREGLSTMSDGAPQAADQGPEITFGTHERPISPEEVERQMRQQPAPRAQSPQTVPSPMPQPVQPTMQQAAQPPIPQPTQPSASQPTPSPLPQQAARPAQPPRPSAAGTHLPETGRSAQGASSGANVGVPIGPKANEQPEVQERPVIYVDEEGNQVPKPPEPEKMLAEAAKFMEDGKYDEALAVLENVRNIPGLSPELLQRALYAISDCNWSRFADNPLAGYEPIVKSTNEAMNANLRSPRVPDALLRLGLANINVGNLDEGNGYITALMRRFPDYPGVAQGYTALGQGQIKKGHDALAEQSFGIVLDKYPESSQLQAASVGLARALINQNKDQRAQVILDFLSKRWPRYYINDPDFLLTQAANEEKRNHKDEAMALRWLYVNLDPARPGNAPLLQKMGDDYMKAGNPDAANFVYRGIAEKFPESGAAVTAKRRLAEGGIYDSPVTYEQMAKVFSQPGGKRLWKLYSDMADASSTAPEAVMARLKQAMWLYWDQQYPEAMGKAGDFIDDYPEHREANEARNVLWHAFQKELAQSLAEHNYGRILLLWNGFPLVRDRYGKIDPPLRYALAEGWAERGDDQKAFELLSDFLKDPMDPQYGEAAFSKFFNHYLQQGAWNKILDLGKLVRNWKMKPELQNQLDYAQALSAQNLNLVQPALNRWKILANRSDIPLYQQAYATYFVAKDAEQRRDIRNAYEYNRKVVQLFQKLADERSDKADPERIKEAISALMDICEVGNRVPEALEWVDRYSAYVPDDSPEYAGLRYREARLYRKLGDATRSQALLEDVVKKFPETPFGKASAAELRSFDVSRDLQRFVSGTPKKTQQTASGSTSGNWSSTAPAE